MDKKKLSEAAAEISYVAGALEETRESKYQEDLMRVRSKILDVIQEDNNGT